MEVRNLHTFEWVPDTGHVLRPVDAVGVVDTDTAENWGRYSGDPATLDAGDMAIWVHSYDPEEGLDPYTGSWVKTTGCQIWYSYDAGSGDWFTGKTIQVGLIYAGADIGALTVDLVDVYRGDGYYALFVTYPSKSPPPQVVWLVGASYVPTEPTGPTAFWTGFVGARELGVDGSGEPSAGGSDHTTATVVSAPYTATLGAIGAGESVWFKLTLASGSYTFNTTGSPLPSEHDTYLALFDGSGNVVAYNDDVDLDGGDYRSSITRSLSAGTYYLAVCGYNATVSGGFTISGAESLIAGTVLNIAAA